MDIFLSAGDIINDSILIEVIILFLSAYLTLLGIFKVVDVKYSEVMNIFIVFSLFLLSFSVVYFISVALVTSILYLGI